MSWRCCSGSKNLNKGKGRGRHVCEKLLVRHRKLQDLVPSWLLTSSCWPLPSHPRRSPSLCWKAATAAVLHSTSGDPVASLHRSWSVRRTLTSVSQRAMRRYRVVGSYVLRIWKRLHVSERLLLSVSPRHSRTFSCPGEDARRCTRLWAMETDTDDRPQRHRLLRLPRRLPLGLLRPAAPRRRLPRLLP